MDPDSPATKRRRIESTASTSATSAELQHQSQYHNFDAKAAKTDFEPPSTSGTSSGDFQLYTAPSVNPTITISSPINFEDFLTETLTAGVTTGEPSWLGEHPNESEEPEPNDNNEEPQAEEDPASVRERHNNIGRRYRNKLNEQFENLQALLAQQDADASAQDDNEHEEPNDDENGNNSTARDSSASPTQTRKRRKGRGINKASLLEMAKLRIETLTEQREMLMAEVEQLEKELASQKGKKKEDDHQTY